MAVIAMEVTVVTTALPSIVGELDRIDLFPWVFTAYLLTSTVTVPLFGKLADVYGRRRVFTLGVAVFLVGSVLCGAATSMEQLIGYRALQGLGAGALMPTIFTMIADLYPLEERGRIQGLFSGLWGVSSLAGPAFGAWLTLAFSWRAVFLVGVPFGTAALFLIGRYFRERVEQRTVYLDYLGSGLLLVGLTALLLLITQSGASVAWGSPAMIGLATVAAGCLVGFSVAERGAKDPVVPPSLFGMRIVTVALIGNVLSGAVLWGVTSYVPLYVQGVLGDGVAGAGAVITPMLVAWSVTAFFGPKLLLRVGFFGTALGATILIALGAAGLALLGPDSPRSLLYLAMTVMGAGFGPSTAAFVMAVQEAVPWNMRGAATSSTQLFRSLGGAIGVAVMGAALQHALRAQLVTIGADPALASAILDPHRRGSLPVDVASAAQAALGAAMQPIFLVNLGFAVAGVLALLTLGSGVRHRFGSRAAAPAAPDPAPARSG